MRTSQPGTLPSPASCLVSQAHARLSAYSFQSALFFFPLLFLSPSSALSLLRPLKFHVHVRRTSQLSQQAQHSETPWIINHTFVFGKGCHERLLVQPSIFTFLLIGSHTTPFFHRFLLTPKLHRPARTFTHHAPRRRCFILFHYFIVTRCRETLVDCHVIDSRSHCRLPTDNITLFYQIQSRHIFSTKSRFSCLLEQVVFSAYDGSFVLADFILRP
ncbi:hypothetical protein B0H66DRAFT_609682 [Apodospora peruviana]|uniref:Uncharacterized protein n=1 Tax=Apodospora peruviana TaxID=516989 RepID=A0AAE0MDZ3_9PEZI|nr:hypothetical protein B0H66DRAFT_609682 [Apodospora peruviana]